MTPSGCPQVGTLPPLGQSLMQAGPRSDAMGTTNLSALLPSLDIPRKNSTQGSKLDLSAQLRSHGLIARVKAAFVTAGTARGKATRALVPRVN